MENYVIYENISGKILMFGSGPVGIAEMQMGLLSGATPMVGMGHPAHDYVDLSSIEPAIAPRPVATHGWAATGAAPVTLGMGSLPAGTSVTATNEAREAVTTSDPADPIILVDPESYSVTIDPPWPYMPETLTIEVT